MSLRGSSCAIDAFPVVVGFFSGQRGEARARRGHGPVREEAVLALVTRGKIEVISVAALPPRRGTKLRRVPMHHSMEAVGRNSSDETEQHDAQPLRFPSETHPHRGDFC